MHSAAARNVHMPPHHMAELAAWGATLTSPLRPLSPRMWKGTQRHPSVTSLAWCAVWLAATRTCIGCGTTTPFIVSITVASVATASANGLTCAATLVSHTLPMTVAASLHTWLQQRRRLLSAASSSRHAPPGSNSTWLPCTPVVGTHRAHCGTMQLQQVRRPTRLPLSCSTSRPCCTTLMLQLLNRHSVYFAQNGRRCS